MCYHCVSAAAGRRGQCLTGVEVEAGVGGGRRTGVWRRVEAVLAQLCQVADVDDGGGGGGS